MNNFNRRDFLQIAAGGLAVVALSQSAKAQTKPKIKAVAFDAFPIFDPRPIFEMVNQLFGEKGPAIANTWRTAQFDYTWLRTSGNQYVDFWKVTEDALIFALKKNNATLSEALRKQIMEQYLHLKAWPDVLPVLTALKAQGIKTAFLSNFTADMLNANIKSAELDGYFDLVLSTDKARAFKPSPKAYQLGVDALKLKKEEIAFAAFAGWDAVGAKWFGYPTYWCNRQNNPLDELSAKPDIVSNGLSGLLDFVKA